MSAAAARSWAVHGFTVAALLLWWAYAQIVPAYQLPGPVAVAARMLAFVSDPQLALQLALIDHIFHVGKGDPIGREAEVHVLELKKGSREQAATDEQDHRQRHFGDHERRTQPRPADCRDELRATTQPRHEVEPRHTKCGHDAE